MPAQAAACVLNITVEQFNEHLEKVAAALDADARRLAERPEILATVDHLPLSPGATVMAVGDSVTAYRRSYAELLRVLLALRRPGDEIRFLNRAQSGYTSTHARRSTYSQYIKEDPELVFILLGGNDCERFGGPEARTLVSFGEYRENMEAIIHAFQTHTRARLVLLTPAPVIQHLLRKVPDFRKSRMSWSNTDLEVCSDVLRSLAFQYRLPLVDLMETFGPDPDPDLYFVDGLHPGPAGEELILEHLLVACEALT